MLLVCLIPFILFFFFFNDTATTEIYTLSLHDALPICRKPPSVRGGDVDPVAGDARRPGRSEEHTSELQSRLHLVCRLLLEKKKKEKGVLQIHHSWSKQRYNDHLILVDWLNRHDEQVVS